MAVVQVMNGRWDHLTAGSFSAGQLENFANAMEHGEANHLTQLVGIQVIDTVVRRVPSSLAGTGWSSPTMIDAMHGLLDQLIPSMRNRVQYISIGNEVDLYFEERPQDELDTYRAFCDDAARYLRQHLPGVQVGITVPAGGWLGADVQRWLDLSVGRDVMTVR